MSEELLPAAVPTALTAFRNFGAMGRGAASALEEELPEIASYRAQLALYWIGYARLAADHPELLSDDDPS